MLNPEKRIVKSSGIDVPVMYVYLAGRIAGDCIDQCLEWRHKIIDHYSNYKGEGAYPISFLDALNSKESDSVDAKGLTSAIPPNLIYDKDLFSVEKAAVVVANLEDYMEVGIQREVNYSYAELEELSFDNLMFAYKKLQKAIKYRRPNYGTTCELSWALYLNKPLILIAGSENKKEMLEKHPFTKRASVIVKDVDELLEKKWLQILYKSMSSAIY